MNGNPFYVQPMGDITQGLSGLTQTVGTIAKERKAQRELDQKRVQAKELAQQAMDVYRSGDIDAMQEFAFANPQFAEAMNKRMGFMNDATKQNYLSSVASLMADPSPENVRRTYEQRVSLMRAQGVENMGDTESFMAQYEANPEQAIQGMVMRAASMFPEEVKGLREMTASPDEKELPAGVQEYQFAKEQGYEGSYLDFKAELQTAGRESGAGSPKQKTGAWLIETPQGETKIVSGVFNPDTGTLETATATIPEASLISALGETAEEQSARKIRTKKGEEKSKAEATRYAKTIETGQNSAQNIYTIRRALDLLDTVQTGGIDAAMLKMKQVLGVETANEGELVNLLATNVLQQLRPTFGTQFTQAEGDWLKAIEAGTGKSVAANIRILERILEDYERDANRAIRAAEREGDFDLAESIVSEMTYRYQGGENALNSSQQWKIQPTQQAIDYLKSNPQLRDQFVEKYGRLPEGM